MKNLFYEMLLFSTFFYRSPKISEIEIELNSELEKVNLSYRQNIDESIDSNNATLLMYAADRNYLNLAKLLIDSGADINKKNRNGLKALDYALAKNNKEIIELIRYEEKENDLTVIGIAKFSDGIGRISIGLIDCLKNDLKINFIKTRAYPFYEETSQEVINIIRKKENFSKTAKIVLLTDLLICFKHHPLLNLKKPIKIAYSMFETSKIPNDWVKMLNNYFDAVVVPDNYFQECYKNSGVKIPIFALPIGLYLNDLLNKPLKSKINKPFVFGCLSSFDPRKNHKLLIEAFIKEFGNSKDVILRINGRDYPTQEIEQIIKKNNITNIYLTKENLTWPDYIKFMLSIDCYINISKGEGFSIGPREALALGIPCILTNNTSQKTICKNRFIYSINSDILEPAYYSFFANEQLGYFFNCSQNDVQKALRDVYQNYNKFLDNALASRNWVKQYLWANLKKKYLNLVKPKKILLGKKNIITDDYLMTSSKILYRKYKMYFNV